MSSGTKRGQFLRSTSSSIPCLTPTSAFVIIAALFCLIGYHYWSQSHRMNSCRLEVARLHEINRIEAQNKLQMQGRLTELHLLMDRQTRLLAKTSYRDMKTDDKHEDKDKRILALENELVQMKEKVERCNMAGVRTQGRIDEQEANLRSSTVIRNKTMCDLEIARQYEEIDKWIKSMVDDRTYSQFQLKFSKDGEKSEADKLQKLEKVVMQRDEIKAVKDERIKEEIRARESKSAEMKVNNEPTKRAASSRLLLRQDDSSSDKIPKKTKLPNILSNVGDNRSN